jgi:hypothetical protein
MNSASRVQGGLVDNHLRGEEPGCGSWWLRTTAD